jgi:hypothetical protein
MSRSFAVFASLLFTVLIGTANAADVCSKWFSDNKIKFGPNCLSTCASSIVDMDSFQCPMDCAKLCKESATTDFLFEISDLYPALTTSERALISKEPMKMLKAYQISWKAESQCKQLYQSSKTNDESDACRHFVWAGLLTKEFTRKFAEQVLDAHEQEPVQSEKERTMDVKNNQSGISAVESLLKSKKYSDKSTLDEFLRQLKSGRIVVLKPKQLGKDTK